MRNDAHHLNVVRWIQRCVKNNYRDGFTVSDVCSSVKIIKTDLILNAGIGENELFDIVEGYLVCNTQIKEENLR
jgi:hypothetical protein